MVCGAAAPGGCVKGTPHRLQATNTQAYIQTNQRKPHVPAVHQLVWVQPCTLLHNSLAPRSCHKHNCTSSKAHDPGSKAALHLLGMRRHSVVALRSQGDGVTLKL